MTREQAVEDLRVLKDYFIHESGGSYPLCIEYAIKMLEKKGETNGANDPIRLRADTRG